MITISGRDITRDNSEFPSLYDAGYSLSRIPRFNGYTNELYTVLHHLIGCYEYARSKNLGYRIAMYALTHDIAEAVTNDICPPWKTDDFKELQRQLDERFYLNHAIGAPDGFTRRIVKQIDNQMVYAEAKLYAPQVAEHILKPGPNYREGINTLDEPADKAVVYAAYFLAPYLYDPNVCGILYRDMVNQAIWATQQERKHGEVQGSL